MSYGNGRKRLAVILASGSLAAGAALDARPASAGVEVWRVNEVWVDPAAPARRYVELHAPPSMQADACFFPGTRLEIFDGAGQPVGQVAPTAVTVCFAGDWYVLFASPEAAAALGTTADRPLPVPLDAAAGQVCLSSGGVRYDCVRWGAVSVAVTDQTGAGDGSAAPALAGGAALERRADTDVVAADFGLDAPTPRGPNDGTPWMPPDAGPLPDAGPEPDAAPVPDAAPPVDAGIFPDAPPGLFPDARTEPPAWLDAEPGGGGGCAVGARSGRSGGWLVLLALALVYGRRRS